jgi:hypothetical protein
MLLSCAMLHLMNALLLFGSSVNNSLKLVPPLKGLRQLRSKAAEPD